jgi:nucleoside-diphosphate-sugar epimerase
MRKILVTGSAGFIGSALCRRLELMDCEVAGIDTGDGDITDNRTLERLAGKKFDHVFHLAGKTFVPESWNHPFDYYRINLLGTVNVLEYCRSAGTPVTCISSYAYGRPDYLPVDESHPLKVYNPYSHSKYLAEDTCAFYKKHFGLKITVIRPFNVYGPGQSDRFLIQRIIDQVLDPRAPEVEVMDLRPRRDYLFLDDLVDALVLSLDGPEGIYNAGSGYSVSVEEVLNRVMDLAGIRKNYISLEKERPNEIFDLFADISKISKAFQWRPATELKDGLALCIRETRNRLNSQAK